MEKISTRTGLLFTMNGMNAVLGWNAVLAALDYFQDSFPSFNIYSFLPVPVFAGYMLVGINYRRLSKRFKYMSILTFGSIAITITLAAILLVSLLFKESALGFGLLLLSAFTIGVGSNLFQLTILAMVNYLSRQIVAKYTVGTAFSGLSINLVRVIILAIAGAKNQSIVPIIIYFAIAVTFNTIVLLLNLKFSRSDEYKQKIANVVAFQQLESSLVTSNQVDQDLQEKIISKEQTQTDNSSPKFELKKANEQVQEQRYFHTLLQVSKEIFPYPLILTTTLAITYILFPGPSFDKTFANMETSWSVMLILLYFNVGDSIGKFYAGMDRTFNKHSLIFLFIARIFFALPITVMANGMDIDSPWINNHYFPFINQFLFGFTNGLCISASFIMAFKVCPPKYKKYAGVFCGLSLQFGIILGTVLEIPYSYIFGIN